MAAKQSGDTKTALIHMREMKKAEKELEEWKLTNPEIQNVAPPQEEIQQPA